MERKRNRLPSPAMVVGIMALWIAVVGTATALPGRNTVNSGDIKKNGVKSSDIAPKAVHSSDLGTIVERDVTTAGIEESSGNNPERAESDCNPGEIALAPTLSPVITQDDGDLAITELTFDPNGDTSVAGDQGWIIGVSNLDDDGGNETVQVERSVLCLRR